MDVFLMVRRKKTTLFTDAKETTPIYELKKIIEGVLKISPDNLKLFKDELELDDSKTLGEYGFTSAIARAQSPATIGLACRLDNGEFEILEVTSLSSPPELPEVMKPQETQTHEQN
ncbi:hypothetical protein CHUAL_005424 [Chamberlinius hualienensis]